MRGVNDDEVVDLAAFGRAKGVGIRFIEFMPLDAPGNWSMDQVVPAQEILDAIDAVFPLERDALPAHDPAPAERYRYADGVGDLGVIASVTQPVCGRCDRVRLNDEGKVRTCLFALVELDLRAILHVDVSADDLEAEVVRESG